MLMTVGTNNEMNNTITGAEGPTESHDIEVDCLIIGTGPAGASLACFLAQNGLTGLLVTRDSSNANTPRAHIMNMAALDCLRDVGLDEQCYKIGMAGDTMMHTRWSESFAGEEYARIYSWGNGPNRKGDYERASPSKPIDLPQTLLEPILVRYATLNGFQVRFDTSFVSFDDDGTNGLVRTRLHDNVVGTDYHVRSRYLFGADGARSRIARQLELPMIEGPGQGFAINILIEADLGHLMDTRKGNLHWLLTPGKEHPDFAWIGCMRMVKPWHEWLCIIFPEPGAVKKVRKPEEYMERVREFIGDHSVEVTIKGMSTWIINEVAAEKYSKGSVFCLGDAVHRHPPNHGLGSNTCIQDAHNLAWKVAYVEKAMAGKQLLATYDDERQPVSLDVVTHANASLRNHKKIWDILGNLQPTVSSRLAAFRELKENSPKGRARREELRSALKLINREEHGLGIEMNQRYKSSAIYTADQGDCSVFDSDPLKYYHPTTYPGARLPHAWLSKTIPSKQVSTIDLAGRGCFALFTGIGGDGWEEAVRDVRQKLKAPVNFYRIGFRQEWEDVYGDWAGVRGVEESGCVLARPDHFVAWRCHEWSEARGRDLFEVVKSVLSIR